MENENYDSAYIYLNEDYYNHPKETFKFILSQIKSHITSDEKYSLLDIGCARGEFLYYLSQQGMFSDLVGVDYSQTLINQAKAFNGLKDACFYCGSGETFVYGKKVDFITMIGVLSFFDDVTTSLNNIKKNLGNDGAAFLLGIFNPYDVDVLVKYRNNKYNSTYESGWNNHSINTIKKTLNEIDMKLSDIKKFTLPFEIDRQDDPTRSWTVDIQNERYFLNGIGFLFDLYLLKIIHR